MRTVAHEVGSSDETLRMTQQQETVVAPPQGRPPQTTASPQSAIAANPQQAEPEAPSAARPRTPSPTTGWNWQRYLVRRVLALGGNPLIAVVLPGGDEVRASTEPPVAWIHIRDRATLVRVFLNPFIEFGEAYTDGGVQVEGDLVDMLVAVEHSMRGAASERFVVRLLSWLARRRPRNSLSASRKNIHHHYDLGNDFYRLWLDDTLAYTCAYFPASDATLEAAQRAKYDHVCRKLQLAAGDKVIEAGCGWGGLALHMARHYGATVRAYNISHEQIVYARARAAREGLADRVQFIEDDWRNIAGRCDVFASVGMLEHVGPSNYKRLGEVIDRCLSEEGRGLIHTIGRNAPQPVDPWIERRIFPGSYAPSLGEMMRIFQRRGFSVLDVENLRLHYAQTLRHWLARFERSVDRVAAMFDERFVRMWRLYLCGSIAAFQAGSTQLFQVVFARGTSNAVPMTREHLYVTAE